MGCIDHQSFFEQGTAEHHLVLNVAVINSFMAHIIIPYGGKLSREKTLTNFTIFQPSAKVFSTKF